MSAKNVHDVWNTYWDNHTRHRQNERAGMPANWQAIDSVQGSAWKEFARKLPPKARILDLATGDGRVMTHVLDSRRDLKALGIDRAAMLPTPPRGAKIKGGTEMESLPSPDSQFAAVTSQFGFEYGDMPKISRQVARVLRPNGQFALMSHREDGPIVAHNRKRREELDWALEQEELLKLAHKSLGLRSAGIAALPPAVIAAPEKGAALFGKGSAASQIAEAIRQTLHLGRQDSAANVGALLDAIGKKAANELGRIASLEVAARAISDRELLLGTLGDAGFELESERELVSDLSPKPFADFRIFRLTT
ncbi:MAG: methyltransferase domain-containing protein [Alteraurantiacibacter sp.]